MVLVNVSIINRRELCICLGYMFEQLLSLDIKYAHYTPTRGGCYMMLPKSLRSSQKRAVININSSMEKLNCFELSVLCGMFYKTLKAQGKNLASAKTYMKYVKDKILKFPCPFPMPISQIPRFETMNNLKINVYSLKIDSQRIYPLHISKREKGLKINLLLILSKQSNHFCYIENLNALATVDRKIYKKNNVFCERCLTGMMTLPRVILIALYRF